MRDPDALAPNCPYCSAAAHLVTGAVVYPARPDLAGKWFWRCAPCDAWVGCHPPGSWHLVEGRRVHHHLYAPLGRLANALLRRRKQAAHAAFDPIWKSGTMERRAAYAWLAAQLGRTAGSVHVGEMDEADCQRVVDICRNHPALLRSTSIDPFAHRSVISEPRENQIIAG